MVYVLVAIVVLVTAFHIYTGSYQKYIVFKALHNLTIDEDEKEAYKKLMNRESNSIIWMVLAAIAISAFLLFQLS